MTATIIASLTTIAFAIAAWLGTFLAEALCADLRPYEDGPAPVAFPRWPFPLAGAIVGLASALHGTTPLHLGVLALVMAALAASAASDMRCGMIPDVLSVGPLVLVVGLSAYERTWAPVFGAAFVLLPFAVTALFSRGRGMGWGDVKLAALGGALLGARDAALAFTLASVAAYLIARRSGGLRRPIAFGPYLAGSIIVALALERSV